VALFAFVAEELAIVKPLELADNELDNAHSNTASARDQDA
jgi:hypothetical protein